MPGDEHPPVDLTLAQARRLILTKQRLLGRPPAPTKESIVSLARDLAYFQLDPVNIVAPALDVELWSRIGPFRASHLQDLIWKEKRLFEYCAHALSLVPTEDYALYSSLMRRYPESLSKSWGSWRAEARRWIPAHRALRRAVLRELRKGPKRAAEFPDHARTRHRDGGWGSGSDVTAMLFHLWMSGEVMTVGYDGREKIWGLTEEFLPRSVERTPPTVSEVEYRFAQRAIRAMGIAGRREITFYVPRGFYQDLPGTLARLEEDGKIHPVRVTDRPARTARYIHESDLELLDGLSEEVSDPCVTLLSPFDSVLCHRGRVEELFGFDYFHENYVPKEKRRFGVYVLPLLQGDRFIGRIDPKLDRERQRLVVNAVHAEADAPKDRATARAVAASIEGLAEFLGAKGVEYSARVPSAWKGALR
jgi:uncharacterized protein